MKQKQRIVPPVDFPPLLPPRIARAPFELVGNTPLVSLKPLSPPNGAEIYGKLESLNPGGSVKDRICVSMIRDAERRGILGPDSVVIEPTSGNTGIGLAWVCAARGYTCIITMPEGMSIERVRLLRALGAEVVLTPFDGGMAASILEAEAIARRYGQRAFIPQQFENPANPQAHRETTGPEILSALESMQKKPSAFVAGVGTGGTITGVGEVLKARYPEVKVIAVEPKASAILSGGKPGPHQIQGIGAGFIPRVLNLEILDEVITVSDEEALATQQRIFKETGLSVGISSGANVFAAMMVAERFSPEEIVITMLCDTGERYLSLNLWRFS